MKAIKFQGKVVQLVKHAKAKPVAGSQPHEAGEDANGSIYFKGKTGRWTRAGHTEKAARAMLTK